jgi:hypothetical protein
MTHRDIADYMYELPLPEWSDRAGSKIRAVDFDEPRQKEGNLP